MISADNNIKLQLLSYESNKNNPVVLEEDENYMTTLIDTEYKHYGIKPQGVIINVKKMINSDFAIFVGKIKMITNHENRIKHSIQSTVLLMCFPMVSPNILTYEKLVTICWIRADVVDGVI